MERNVILVGRGIVILILLYFYFYDIMIILLIQRRRGQLGGEVTPDTE